MRNLHFPSGSRSKQRGVVMFVALILLLILSLLGVTAARMQTVEERMARNDDNRQVGAQAAEAALRATEVGLETGTIVGPFGASGGMYAPNLSQGSPLTGLNWNVAANTLSYSSPAVAGAALTSLPVVSQNPKIVVEQMITTAQSSDDISMTGLTSPTPVNVYRVTAQGVGADGTSTTMLQTIVR
jgi:type IV pilus assembly protein PilX